MANIKRCNVSNCKHGDGTCCQNCDVEFISSSTDGKGHELICCSFQECDYEKEGDDDED